MSTPLIEIRDLVKHFPIRKGIIFQKQVGAVQAVDGVSFDINEGETLGLVGESGCGKSTTARLITRLLDPTSGSIVYNGIDIAGANRRALLPLRREMQMIFQDPYSSLNPRKTVGVDHRRAVRDPWHRARQGQAPAQGAGPHGAGRAQPGALQPAPARVLRRPAPAHRRRARDRAQAQADRRRRAGLGTRRLDPGADPQPAARPAARAGPDDRLHRPRPQRRAPHVRPGCGHVPRQDRRARRRTAALRPPSPPVHRRAAQRGPGARPAPGAREAPPGARRRRAVADEPAARLPLPHALPEVRRRALRRRGAAARGQAGRQRRRLPLPADRRGDRVAGADRGRRDPDRVRRRARVPRGDAHRAGRRRGDRLRPSGRS